MMRFPSSSGVLAVLLMVGLLAGPAMAGEVVLQGPAVTWDMPIAQPVNHTSSTFNFGGQSYVSTYTRTSLYEGAGVLKFDLSGINTAAPDFEVLSAELKIRRVAGNGTFYARQLTKGWVEGGNFVDGGLGYASANAFNSTQYQWTADGSNGWTSGTFHHIAGSAWTPGAYADTWYYDVGADLMIDPTNSGELYVRSEYAKTYDRLRNYETNSTTPARYASEADLHAAAPFTGYMKLGYYWDETNQRLYVSRTEGAADDPGDVFYALAADAWNVKYDIVGGYSTTHGANASTSDNPTPTGSGEWVTFNDAGLLQIVKNWLENGDANNGFKIDTTTNYQKWLLSELKDASGNSIKYDFVNGKFQWESGYDTGNGVDLAGYEPMLTITYAGSPVPEPATLGLLALGGLMGLTGMMRRRRRV